MLQHGDVVVVDIGGPLPTGYFSDCTRTYALGVEPSPEVRKAYAVLRAPQGARSRPSAPASPRSRSTPPPGP